MSSSEVSRECGRQNSPLSSSGSLSSAALWRRRICCQLWAWQAAPAWRVFFFFLLGACLVNNLRYHHHTQLSDQHTTQILDVSGKQMMWVVQGGEAGTSTRRDCTFYAGFKSFFFFNSSCYFPHNLYLWPNSTTVSLSCQYNKNTK